MKAIVYRDYGSADVLRCEDVEKPAPGDHEVLIKVRAAAANPMDYGLMGGLYLARLATGLRRPKPTRPGADLAGEVEAVGKDVTRFRPGDAVFGAARGAFSQYVCGREDRLAAKPAGISFEQAAAIPVAGSTALQGLRDRGRVRPGQKVLINGASGGVGTFAVQIARSLGAEVTGVCSGSNAELVRSLGADHVIDYTRDDFTRGAGRYDVMLDCVGNRPLSACRRVLTRRGIYVAVGVRPGGRWVGPLPHLLTVLATSPFLSQKVIVLMASIKPADLALLAGMIEARELTPAIDRRYPLAEVPEAIRYLQQGHARGKVIITVDPGRDS
jgi:NADPH:quinone reductase-like Zn-dependent oxidoreductase